MLTWCHSHSTVAETGETRTRAQACEWPGHTRGIATMSGLNSRIRIIGRRCDKSGNGIWCHSSCLSAPVVYALRPLTDVYGVPGLSRCRGLCLPELPTVSRYTSSSTHAQLLLDISEGDNGATASVFDQHLTLAICWRTKQNGFTCAERLSAARYL